MSEMSESKHTSLPWEVEPETGLIYSTVTGEGAVYLARMVTAEDFRKLHGEHGVQRQMGLRRANMDFVVRACNAYYDLLSALKSMLDHAAINHGSPSHEAAVAKARAAVAKAEGTITPKED